MVASLFRRVLCCECESVSCKILTSGAKIKMPISIKERNFNSAVIPKWQDIVKPAGPVLFRYF